MRNIAKAAKSAIFALALALTACNNSDDISEIFIGHDWRLTYIEEGGIRRWPSQNSGYSLMFGENSFDATTPNGGKISGRWSANGETRQFSCTNIRTEGISANDTIARQMVELLKEAKSYDGDIHYLQIIKEKNHLMQFYNR